MRQAAKRIVYVKSLLHPVYAETLAQAPDLELIKVEAGDPDDCALAVFREAHAYQITSTRAGLHPKYYGDEWLLAHAPNLLIISTNAAGYDTIDLSACTAAGVLVVNQAGGNSEAVAEHVLGMMLCLSKRIVETDHIMRREPNIVSSAYMGGDVFGKIVGIIGLGHVGQRVAELCRNGFKMNVLAYDPYVTEEKAHALGAEKSDLNSLLRRSDFVSINCPLTDETRGMIGSREFAQMQPHAYFITTARGGICDEVALAQALARKQIAGAGVDVWQQEPTSPSHPLMRFDNVLVSPHTAGVTSEARYNITKMAAQQMIGIFAGNYPKRILNPEVWSSYAQRFAGILGFRPEEPS